VSLLSSLPPISPVVNGLVGGLAVSMAARIPPELCPGPTLLPAASNAVSFCMPLVGTTGLCRILVASGTVAGRTKDQLALTLTPLKFSEEVLFIFIIATGAVSSLLSIFVVVSDCDHCCCMY
jgi:hypothetical protein